MNTKKHYKAYYTPINPFCGRTEDYVIEAKVWPDEFSEEQIFKFIKGRNPGGSYLSYISLDG